MSFSDNSAKEIRQMTYHNAKPNEETIPAITKRRELGASRFTEKVLQSANKTAGFRKSPSKQAYLEYLLYGYGTKEYIPACSVNPRQLMSKLLTMVMVNLSRDQFFPSGNGLYHMSVAFPEDRTGDQEVKINRKKSKKRMSTMMRSVSKDYIGVAELDVTINEKCMKNGKGRDLCPHFHILFWTSEPIQPIKLGKKLSKRFPADPDGMKVVKIKKCAETDEDIMRVANYLFKAPPGGKTKWMDKKYDADGVVSGVKIKKFTSPKAHRPIIFSRLAEILSHTDIRKLIISGGEGVPIKNQMIKILVETTELLGSSAPKRFGCQRTLDFWRSMRKNGWGKNYPEPVVED